jgi:hypothetical protein
MEPKAAWDMILHHLEAASSYAEEAVLLELQRKIDAVNEEARQAAEHAQRSTAKGAGTRS